MQFYINLLKRHSPLYNATRLYFTRFRRDCYQYEIYIPVSAFSARLLRQQASIFNIHSKIFMFEIMESGVLAILLSTFPVMAFITEKATGIIATQLRLPCKRDKGKNGEVKLLRPQVALPLSFSKRRFYRKSETYSFQQRKNKQTKQKQQKQKK